MKSIRHIVGIDPRSESLLLLPGALHIHDDLGQESKAGLLNKSALLAKKALRLPL